MTNEQYKTSFNEYNDLIIESSKRCQNTSSTLLEILNKISKSGGGNNSNYTIDEISNFLSYLTFEQTVAIVHIFGFIVIIISLISLFTVFYGNKLIDYFQLENRLPKVARFIQLRRKFQMYYSVLDFILILTIISIMFYIDLSILNL